MARKRSLTSHVKRHFGLWDIFILAVLGFYLYGVYTGLDSPAWRVFDKVAAGLFFVYVSLWIAQFFKRRTRV